MLLPVRDRVARPGTPVQFVLAGSILLKQPRFGAQVGRELRRLWPKALVTPLKRESVWGAVELARRALESKVQSPKSKVQGPRGGRGGCAVGEAIAD